MGSKKNFTSFQSATYDEISLLPNLSLGGDAYAIQTHNRTVIIRGIPEPGISCRVGHMRGVVCPIYIDDSGSTIIPGSPPTYVQLSEVFWGGNGAATSIVAFASSDQSVWTFASIVANASWFKKSQEGPSENALALLADRKTLLTVMRMDGGDGVPGSPLCCSRRHTFYYGARSTDTARSWTKPTAILGTGSARPRLAQLGNGAGPLIMSGGRALNLNTRDVLMWVSSDGMGDNWTRISVSYWHNLLATNASDHFTKQVNSTDPHHPSNTGAETSGYTTVRSLDGHTGIITYDRGVFPCATPSFSSAHDHADFRGCRMVYSMRFHF